jgi:hypothetical protein
MNLGRPVMISTSKDDPIPLPLENDQEDVYTVEMSSLTPDQSVLTFFVASTKLYSIAQQILCSFYSEDNERSMRGYEKYFEGKASIFRFDRALQGWYDEILPHLQFRGGAVSGETENDWQMTFRRQAVVLRLRYVPRDSERIIANTSQIDSCKSEFISSVPYSSGSASRSRRLASLPMRPEDPAVMI